MNTFEMKLDDITIKHSHDMKVLGITLNDQLNWKNHVLIGQQSIIKQLKTRIYTLKKILPYMDLRMRKSYTTVIF